VADEPLLMDIAALLDAVGGICLCDYSERNGFSSVATDSRNVLPGSLFVPLIGEFQDGHAYIAKALENGASVVFIDTAHGDGSSSLFCGLARRYHASIVMVEDTLRALQDAARRYVAYFPDLLKIGITGSSGKTTTKEIIGSIFSRKYRVVMNEGNLNSETGLPLSVFKIRKEHEAGIFELGMNRRGEISEIARVLSPSLALITNIGTAHIGILGTQGAIAEEKKSVFSFFDADCTGFVPEGDPWRDFLSDIPAGNIRLFGKTATEGFTGSENRGMDGTLIRYSGLEMRFPLPGTYNLQNALGAIALARHAGISPSQIKEGIEAVKPLFGRAEVIRGEATVLMDCYNANPDSMESAIEFCGDLDWDGKKIFVLGSMLELGPESAAAHRSVCQLAARSGAASVFLFGDEMIDAGRKIEWTGTDVRFFADIESLVANLRETVSSGDLVFVKGSRGMALERALAGLPGTEKSGAVHA